MGSVTPTHRWLLPDRTPLPPETGALAAARGLSVRAAGLLAARGHRTPADLVAYFDEPAAGLHDPQLLPDAEAVVDRLARARRDGERALVFGDFDADGLTGLAILTLSLRRLGIDAAPYVPDRAGEGHGLSAAAIATALADRRSLILTVDTGTSSVDEVAAATEAGIDVLIADHHHVPARRPRAVALVNPHRTDSSYPDRRLAGTGVAFKLAQLLASELSTAKDEVLDLSDLATIGTVADVAPIAGENRAICRLGLERLRAAQRPGLAALCAVAGIDPQRIDLETVAFQIAPRLNAGGRMGESMLAAELLLAPDAATARPLAERLEAANRARRTATAAAVAEARAASASQADDPLIVVAGDWPVGIIGLIAGRLAEDQARPAVVVAAQGPSWRVSARAPEGSFDLAAAFEACAHLLDRHGGHPQAAGCELAPLHLPAFAARLQALAAADVQARRAADGGTGPRRELRLDLVVAAPEVDYGLLRDLQALAPTGPGNPPPVVGVSGLTVVRVRSASGGHTSLTLRKGREVLDGIAFERADLVEHLAEGDGVEIAARLASRTFGGYESLQLEVRDVAQVGHLAELARSRAAEPPALVGSSPR